jgi:hypothetical protein
MKAKCDKDIQDTEELLKKRPGSSLLLGFPMTEADKASVKGFVPFLAPSMVN